MAALAGAGAAAERAAPPPTYVAVSVATLWVSPKAPRGIDAPALARPAGVRRWTASLDTAERRALVGRIETQALLGERVVVVSRQGAWARVAVPDQPTPRDRRGYPGWVPAVQLVSSTRFSRLLAGRIAVVTKPTVQMRVGTAQLELSYGTRLPLVGSAGTDIVAALPDGRTGRIVRAGVATYTSARAIPRPSPAQIVAAARLFLGVRYLWGGTSAFGLDCSGLIELVYRARGRIVPRDADAQARAGTAVARPSLRPADLVFYGRSHVHHATLYVGGGSMIESPNSASRVRVAPLRLTDYAGARRYVG